MFTTCSSSLQFLKNHIQILWKLLHRGNTSLNSELCSSSVKVPPDSTAECLMVPLCLLQFTSRPIWKMTSWRRRWKRWESPDAVVWAGGLECRRTDVHLLLHKDQFSFQLQTKSVLFSWDDVKPPSTKNVFSACLCDKCVDCGVLRLFSGRWPPSVLQTGGVGAAEDRAGLHQRLYPSLSAGFYRSSISCESILCQILLLL